MTEAEARTALERMVAKASQPTLSTIELDALVAMAKRPDAAGVLPAAVGWVPTWELNAAAAEGWRWKAGKASGDFTFSTDGQTFQLAQVYAHCLRQAQDYANRVVESARVVRDSLIP